MRRSAVFAALVLAGLLATACASPDSTNGSGAGSAASSPTGAGTGAAVSSPDGSTAGPAPSCPDRYQTSASNVPWVPASPQGVDGAAQLVPKQTPLAAVVCAYRQPDQGALTGAHELAGNLGAIPAALSNAPSAASAPVVACPLYFRAVDADNYLIGLRYSAGQLWVSAPGFHCSGSGNGAFTSSANLALTVASVWYDARASVSVSSPAAARSS